MIHLSKPKFNDNAYKYIKDCLDSSWVSYAGDYVSKLENAVKDYTNAEYAIALNGGTSALMLALHIAGVGHNDEVLVPSLTFIATINAIKHVGAEPVFMDCDNTLNIDSQKTMSFIEKECTTTRLGLQNNRTGRLVKAILPVHIFGNLSDAPIALNKVAKENGLRIIEDAAEALGTWSYSGAGQGMHAGTFGDMGILSFSFNKMITAGGGGMIITNNKEYGEKAKYLALQAKDDAVNYVHNDVGYNLGLTNIAAALAYSQMEDLGQFLTTHHTCWDTYKEELKNTPGIELIGPSSKYIKEESNFWLIGIKVNKEKFGIDKNELMRQLYVNGVQTRPLWIPSHLQMPYLKCQRYRLEKTELIWKETLCLPSGNTTTAEQCREVARIINELQKERS